MSRDDPNVRLRHMLDYSREAVALLRDRKRADLDSERTLGWPFYAVWKLSVKPPAESPLIFNSVIKISRGRKLLACAIDSFTGMTSWITISSGARSPKICRR
jgi:hypothetical protein